MKSSIAMEWFLLFGDSITQHSFSQDRGFAFGAALSDAYVRRLDVINRGFSGYNTAQGLQVLPQIMPQRSCANVRFITFWFGANDSRLPNTPGNPQQHVPLDQFTENTKLMVTHPDVLGHENIRRILITPPPTDERQTLEADKRGIPDIKAPRRKAEETKKYAEAVCQLGKELDIPVIDLWAELITRAGGSTVDPVPTGSLDMPQNAKLQSFFYDGLHLSPDGYRVLYEVLTKLIQEKWPDQVPDKLDFVLPRWDHPTGWESKQSTL